MLFAHHMKSWFGLEIEINDQPFPGGMLDHVQVPVGHGVEGAGEEADAGHRPKR